MVLFLLVFISIEGLVHPCLTALMTRDVPDDAQGELQGGLASLMNIATLGSALFFTQIFGWFARPEATTPRPGAPFLIAAAIMGLALVLFVIVRMRGTGSGGLTKPETVAKVAGPATAPETL
jgi:DHA1 family tetracycline resistance protein-like MFS transporter